MICMALYDNRVTITAKTGAWLLTRVQLFAFGSNSVTLVICLRKSDSCIPGWEPRRLNCARGFTSITWRFTANPVGENKEGVEQCEQKEKEEVRGG